ncbi:tRNA uridine 5-carboxymethylaminomethyl modification enzyme [Frankliniella fusca]|uniref:tRNA uridine 5-carboxymethylaminomethyl modification enzyme n=1 Tax=Frankliniella fusca TaxID=407009 RepID=A0AAE1H3L0_9NEOP|nr:tRNA uridine 5-carboxymethylaminomethyl modification enzyme [Frankliniella fusca]
MHGKKIRLVLQSTEVEHVSENVNHMMKLKLKEKLHFLDGQNVWIFMRMKLDSYILMYATHVENYARKTSVHSKKTVISKDLSTKYSTLKSLIPKNFVKHVHPTFKKLVNEPVDIDTTVSCIPTALSDSNMIHVKLARRMQYEICRKKPVPMKERIELSADWNFSNSDDDPNNFDDEFHNN